MGAGYSHCNLILAIEEEPPGRHEKVKRKGKHQCHFCNYSNDHAANVETHERSHAGKKPYVCSVCCKGFTEKRSLDRHCKAVHEDLRKYTCSLCGSAFKRRQHLQYHERVHLK
ncbi:zinc finger protein 596-like [Ornithodoros turicata]|uniref:zinc finger protein 596-like n=1 Tax=Ornithodoros turicata TaxID=34597 RepID=UPI003139D5B6